MEGATVALIILNLLIGGIIAAMYRVGKRRENEYPGLKKYLTRISVILAGFLAVLDLAYYLNSRVMALISFVLFLSLVPISHKDEDNLLRRRFEVESKKPCETITVKALLLSKDYSCLIELARRTSVSFAITVYYLLTVAILVPVFSGILFIFFWFEGVIYFISLLEVVGYSLIIAAVALAPTAYLLKRNLLKIRVRELSESKLT